MTIRFKAKANKSAEILIYSDIGASWWGDGTTAKGFADDLKALGDVDSIDVRINSYGGDVFDGLAIHRQLVDHKATITTHIDGIAASIASVIAMAGSKIVISESGYLMIHDAWTIALGNAEELRGVADRIDATSATMAELYAKRSGASADVMRNYMREETWFDGPAAVAAGLADETAQNVAVAARGRPDWAARYMKVPDLAAPKIAPVETPMRDAMRDSLASMRTRIEARKPTPASARG